MEQKKQTNAQLQRRIERAVVMVERTKETKEIYFYDKGLRLVVNEDCAVIETGYHRHVFTNFTSAGVSRPYIYTKRFVEIAQTNECETADGYSYSKLMESLEKKEDKAEYNIARYVDWWFYNIFQPLYSIGESVADSFLVYEDYLHNIARNYIILSEKTEDITDKKFIDGICANMKEYAANLSERVIFHKKTDEEVMKENIEAIEQMESEQHIVNSEEEVAVKEKGRRKKK